MISFVNAKEEKETQSNKSCARANAERACPLNPNTPLSLFLSSQPIVHHCSIELGPEF